MLNYKPNKWKAPNRDIASENTYLNRRKILKGMGYASIPFFIAQYF